MPDTFGKHVLHAALKKDYQLKIGESKIAISNLGTSFVYKRYEKDELKSETMIVSRGADSTLGIFPNPPLLTPKNVAKNVYLKFKAPVIVEQGQDVEIYAKVPIEIAVYNQSKDDEMLIDAFSLHRQQYALYGLPENGVVCRYKETEVSTSPLEANKFEEAQVKIHIRNAIDNIVKINKLIIPMEAIVFDHFNDIVTLPGSVEMNLDSAFGRDIVNVRLVGVKVKSPDKTSAVIHENNLDFRMDAGY